MSCFLSLPLINSEEERTSISTMTTDQARKQAENDQRNGKGPANTSNWDASSRNAYNAEYERQKQQQNKK